MPASSAPPAIIPASEWRIRLEEHRTRACRHTIPTRRRRGANQPHPVEDFLFTYYRHSLAKLEQWHPAFPTRLEEAHGLPAFWRRSPYHRVDDTLAQDPAQLAPAKRERLRWIHELLVATAGRSPIHHCHGLHEWAMVHRGSEVRHQGTLPLRLPQEEIDALVESRPIRCSHFDAFRFFPASAQPLNRLQPSLDERAMFEQPACVHANMDLYKWAFKAMPWVGSDLLLDCFELALELRRLDMRASPYDLAGFDLSPIAIETADGRRDYETRQQELARRAAPMRERLIEAISAILAATGKVVGNGAKSSV